MHSLRVNLSVVLDGASDPILDRLSRTDGVVLAALDPDLHLEVLAHDTFSWGDLHDLVGDIVREQQAG